MEKPVLHVTLHNTAKLCNSINSQLISSEIIDQLTKADSLPG